MSKKSTKALASATLMSLVLTTALSAGPVKAAAGKVTRTSGIDRYATAASVATSNWTTSDDVVLVSGEGYADAVSASALAKKLNAPILLTTAGTLSTDTQTALGTLKAKNVYVIGGEASVSTSVRNLLKANSYNLVELGGANRYETNAKVAQKLIDLGVKADDVIMVGGEGFSDALSVAPIAAAKSQILLLGMNNASYMQPVLDFISTNKSKVTVVGTKNVISDSILSTVNGTRVDGGSDRFDTNLKVLTQYKDTVKMDKMFIASAQENSRDDGYADALVASALAGKTAAPLVLVDKDGSTATTNAIKYIGDNVKNNTDLNVIGGTGVVSQNVEDQINKAVVDGPNNNGNHTVQSVEAVSLNQIKIHYNAAIDSDSAEDVTNYKIDGTQLTQLDANNKAVDANAAVAKAVDDNTVVITLATARKQYDDVTVSVKKAVLTEDKNNTIDAFDQSVTFSDTTVPTLKNATVEGNSQLTVEFSEAVDMDTIKNLKSKFKIDGQSIGNYGVNEQYSQVKNELIPDTKGNIANGHWGFKVLFYFDSPIPSGNHTLKVSDGDKDGALSDAAGFTFKEATQDFTVDSMTTKPVVKSVVESKSGEISITFDRSMDAQTAEDASNYEINDTKMSDIPNAKFDDDSNHTIIKLKHVGSKIESGSNRLYIKNNVKDAFGNKVADDTRVNFDDIKDETKPTVSSITVIDSETIRVKFSKDVDNAYARNRSNYKLQDSKDIDITNHIDHISSTIGTNDTDDTDTYNIKLIKYSGSEDWRLTGAKYTLTVKNIVDTSSTPNTMDDYTYVINGSDDVSPKGTGIFGKIRSTGTKDKVVVYFSESMDTATLTNKDNYKFINGEGDSKSLPGDVNITVGGDNKSAILEFPSSYNVKIDTTGTNGTTNDVIGLVVSNVKDEAGNVLDGVAYNNNKQIDKATDGASVKEKTIKTYYDGDDLKVDVQFDRAIDEITATDFTLGGVKPTSANISGDKVTLIYKDGAAASTEELAANTVAYGNGLTKKNPTKIDIVKSKGQSALLNITSTVGENGTIDETGAKVSTIITPAQATIYDYEAAPKSTGDDSDAPYWTATKDSNGGKVYVTFDTPLDENSGVKSDDFTFAGYQGTAIKADGVKIVGNTVIFSFDTVANGNKDFASFKGDLDVRAKSTASLRTVKDLDGNNAKYVPSSDDLKKRTVTVTGAAVNNTDLKASIATAQALNAANYTAVSWTAMSAKLTAANIVVVKTDAVQTEIDTAKTDLDAAVKALVKVNTDSFLVGVPTVNKTIFGFQYVVNVTDATKISSVTVGGVASASGDGYKVSGNTVTINNANNTDKVVIVTSDNLTHAIN